MSDDRDELMALAERVLARSAVATDEERKMIHDALRSAASAAVPVAVKALEWPPRCPRGQRVHNRPALVNYTVAHYGGDVDDAIYRWAEAHSPWSDPLPTYDAAKAAAQADYERRIRSALVEVPAVKGEPVAWPSDGSCVRCGAVPRTPSGLCNTCLDEDAERYENAPPADAGMREALADDLRGLGWSVAVHNDYRLNGEAHTFWLFTKGGRAIKGEGRTDAEALNAIRAALTAPGATTKSDGGEVVTAEQMDTIEKAAIAGQPLTNYSEYTPVTVRGSGPSEATTEREPPEWLWWGEVNGTDVVTFGRWPKHGARWRYKLADIQPTEHDHAPSTDQPERPTP